MTAMLLERLTDAMTTNQIFHTPLILEGRNAHDTNRLLDQLGRDDDNSIPIGDDNIFRINDDFGASCCMYRDCHIDGRHLGERSLTERGVSSGKYLQPRAAMSPNVLSKFELTHRET
jgi:hypothetical protein